METTAVSDGSSSNDNYNHIRSSRATSPTNNTSQWRPRVVVLGPGGAKGLMILGFLSTLEDSGLLTTVDTYCGVSIGAIISLLVISGYTIREIVGEAIKLDIFKDLAIFDFRASISNQGLISNEPVKRRLTQLLLDKFGTIPTLRGLYMQTGKAFITVTLNASDRESVIMTPFSHPTISCIDAAMLSMNIPFVFYQIFYEGKSYVDGALANPYPIDFFDDGNTDILGVYLTARASPQERATSNNSTINNATASTPTPLPIGSFWTNIFASLMDQRRTHIIQHASERCKHVCLETKTNNTVGYNLGITDKVHMIVDGYNEGRQFLVQIANNSYRGPNITPKMRYSYPPYYPETTDSSEQS
jgi:predicted acylesterase/phospholipase RssA